MSIMATNQSQYAHYRNDADVVDLDAFRGTRELGTVTEIAHSQLANAQLGINNALASLKSYGFDPEAVIRETEAITREAAVVQEAEKVVREAARAEEAKAVIQEAEAITREAVSAPASDDPIAAARARIEAINTEDTTRPPDYTKVLEEMGV